MMRGRLRVPRAEGGGEGRGEEGTGRRRGAELERPQGGTLRSAAGGALWGPLTGECITKQCRVAAGGSGSGSGGGGVTSPTRHPSRAAGAAAKVGGGGHATRGKLPSLGRAMRPTRRRSQLISGQRRQRGPHTRMHRNMSRCAGGSGGQVIDIAACQPGQSPATCVKWTTGAPSQACKRRTNLSIPE